jgi:hypothetical protein
LKLLLKRNKLTLTVFALLVGLTACDDLGQPTATLLPPTYTGPTVAPSPTVNVVQMTNVPFDEVFIGQNDPTAAALPRDSALPPLGVGLSGDAQQVAITAEDGAQLTGLLYQSGAVRLPGVLMLADSPQAWGDFPKKVADSGFTVLVMTARPQSALADFRVMMQSLSSGEADPARLGVVGAGAGADAALLGCSGEPLCDTVALLSPSGSPSLVNAMAAFNPRPLFVTASEDDSDSFTAAKALQSSARGEVLMQPFNTAGHGVALLINRPALGDLIIQWLKRQLSPQ